MFTSAELLSLTAILMPFLVSYAGALFHYLMGKLPTAQQAQASAVVAQVVSAIEQMYARLPGTGADKKARAVQLAQAILARMGIKLSTEQLDVLIEAAVSGLPKQAVAPTVSMPPDLPMAGA